MTPPYLAALRGVDRGVALLEEFLDDSLIIIMSDHGGGGVEPRDHDIEHPVNRRITLMFAGPEVAAGERLSRPVSLLDVPPTVLDYFGVPVPRGYEGRVIEEAVAQRKEAVA
jgi:arylsulfatase A-like enzyme